MKRYNDDFELECQYLFNDVEKINGVLTDRLNYYKMPITALSFNEENCEMFNHIISCFRGSYMRTIIRTKSGGISAENKHYPAYDVRMIGGCIELTVINLDGSFRLQWRNSSTVMFEDKKLTMSGRQAFNNFKDICKKFGININTYAHDNYDKALQEKQEIPKALIKAVSECVLNKELENCHHIDFHSSYMSGLVNTHPEFKEVVEYIYSKRKDEDIKYKSILNMTQGYMQSELCKYRFAHLSRDMIIDNNERVLNLVKRLIKAGRIPLLYNTDGIWYQGDIYTDGEGTGICTWGNDHKNCRLRIKSSGAYEYIENGKYFPVVRGHTKLDKIKPREEWVWGDIYKENCECIKYTFKDGYIYTDGECKGVIEYEEN